MCSKATSSTSRRRNARWQASSRGITLVELVVVLTVLAIIAVVAAIALRDPVRAYIDSTRRAQLTDIADTALRRMARDIRLALPNSTRVTGAGPIYLEFLLTKTGGRYRAQGDAAGAGKYLDLTTAATCFDTLGPMTTITGQSVAANDIVVVYNLFSSSAITTANAYTHNQAPHCSSSTSANCNSATVAGTGAGAAPCATAILTNETRIRFGARQFPLGSPGNRFHIVTGPVTYICNPGAVDASGNGTGTLTRVSNYTIQLTQPTGTFAGAPVSALLAQNLTSCQITYDPLVLTQSLGLVSIRLELTRGNERVTLYHEVHVSNIP